jgi:ABC-type Fe3+/spermidine/putrescine transport system ATPase subunit
MKLEFRFEQATPQKNLAATGMIDFSAEPIQAVMGPSGVGKSSFAKWICGINSKGHGQLKWQGKIIQALPPQQRRIGYLAQGNGLFPHLTVEENIVYGLRRMPLLERETLTAALLGLSGAKELAKRYPQEISGGEQRRVALAQCLAVRPSLLILDEPFTGLDSEAKALLWEDSKAWLLQEKIPVLLITHDEEEARFFATKIHRYQRGRLDLA